MARDTQVGLPDDDYLSLVGQVAFMVSGLEGTVLHDLPTYADDLPPELTLEELAALPTGVIGRRLEKAVQKITRPDLKAYIEQAAQVLKDASLLRNDMLHARPAMPDGRLRLYRWLAADEKKDGRAIVIESDWLDQTIDSLSELTDRLHKARNAVS